MFPSWFTIFWATLYTRHAHGLETSAGA